MPNTREKLIELLKDSPSLDALDDDGYAMGADHLIASGVTFATDNNVGRWIIRSNGKGDHATNWAECSECHTCGSPQWTVCPVCETKMDGDNDGNL